MSPLLSPPRRAHIALACAVLLAGLAGCASAPDANSALGPASDWAGRHAGTALALSSSDPSSAPSFEQALAGELGADAAVRLALQRSPAVQALLAESWSRQTELSNAARPANPRLALERLVRGDAVELGATLSIGLMELLTQPRRAEVARQRIEAEQLQLARQVLAQADATRRQWVRAVAAAQKLDHLDRIVLAAEAADTLAERMLHAGNFSKLQRLREQSALLDARAEQARGRLAVLTEREALIRQIGLPATAQPLLKLPNRLPDVPKQLSDDAAVMDAAPQQRLDLQLAEARWRAAGGVRQETRLTRWTDVEIGLVHKQSTGEANQNGVDLSFTLPLNGSGAARMQGAQASLLAAEAQLSQTRLEAASQLREALALRRSAHTLARQALDERVPQAQAMTDEVLLRVNGMLLSPFDLLAQARQQAATVAAAIDAQRDYGLADAALQSALLGMPTSGATLSASPSAGPANASGGH
jgi:outer membrane protein TolC